MSQDTQQTSPTRGPANLGHLPGVWRRDLIETKDMQDTESLVFWVQGKAIYGDLRVEPSGRIAFSGQLSQDGSVFSWAMTLSSFDLPEFPDAGRLDWREDGLWEFGVHQEYTEIWRKAGTVAAGDFALWLEHDCGEHAVYLQIGGFTYVMIGQPGVVATDAMIAGACPRFGTVSECLGSADRLLLLKDQALREKAGWTTSAIETF